MRHTRNKPFMSHKGKAYWAKNELTAQSKQLITMRRRSGIGPKETPLVPFAFGLRSRNREWHAISINAGAVEADNALALTASITEWIDDLDGIWGISTASQRLGYATSIAELCRELEGLGYVTHLGHFRQQHIQDSEMIWDVGLITFLPKAEHDGDRYGLVTLEGPWEVPVQDRPKL